MYLDPTPQKASVFRRRDRLKLFSMGLACRSARWGSGSWPRISQMQPDINIESIACFHLSFVLRFSSVVLLRVRTLTSSIKRFSLNASFKAMPSPKSIWDLRRLVNQSLWWTEGIYSSLDLYVFDLYLVYTHKLITNNHHFISQDLNQPQGVFIARSDNRTNLPNGFPPSSSFTPETHKFEGRVDQHLVEFVGISEV